MFIPLPVLFISAGVLFPKGWAIVISSACLTMELTIDWLIGKKMGQTKVVDFVHSKPKMASLIDLYKERAVFTCFLSRLIPIQSEPFSIFFGCLLYTSAIDIEHKNKGKNGKEENACAKNCL